jgi:pimeloyl-ACP methyl ester carboxylesterase
VEVWSKTAEGKTTVAIAFGGTIASSLKDWFSNLRWFIPFRSDEYTQIVESVAPEFAKLFVRKAADPAWAVLKQPTIVTTGQSLGGGLAQRFAYALPDEPGVPRVAQVYAFDPSPVSGYYSVKDATLRERNTATLSINRIYERGEILAIVRSVASLFHPPSVDRASIRGVRYNLLPTRNPILGHSIPELACKLNDVADGRPMNATAP